MKVETEQHTSHLLELLYIKKSLILPQFLPSLYCKMSETKNSLNTYKKTYQPHFCSSHIEASLNVFLYVYVNVSIRKIILLDNVHFVCIFVVYPPKSSPVPFRLNLGYVWWFLCQGDCCLCEWRAAMCENLSGSFIWRLIYYIKVQSDIFGLYRGGNKTHFDNLSLFFLQNKPDDLFLFASQVLNANEVLSIILMKHTGYLFLV